MSILIDKNTTVVVQGITGREGSKATSEMLRYGTSVLAGVTPGKGGQAVEGVPVYDNMQEALTNHPRINACAVYVPPVTLKDAVLEALGNGLKLIQIFTEKVPIKDLVYLRATAQKVGAVIVGPSSVGIITPGQSKLGSIGGGVPERMFAPGKIGIISKSGGLCSEVAGLLKTAGLGVSTAVGIGGEVIAGSDIVDIGRLFEKDRNTIAVVVVGEVGGAYESLLAKAVVEGAIKKPYVAIIGGRFSELLPSATRLGHAGAIVEGNESSFECKVTTLRQAGVLVADKIHEVPALVQKQLVKNKSNKARYGR